MKVICSVPGSVFAATTGVDVETCEDYGVRVQFSLFECWLEDDAYQALWEKLQSLIDAKEDRLVAYSLDAAAVRKRAMAGETMRCTEKVQWYVV